MQASTGCCPKLLREPPVARRNSSFRAWRMHHFIRALVSGQQRGERIRRSCGCREWCGEIRLESPTQSAVLHHLSGQCLRLRALSISFLSGRARNCGCDVESTPRPLPRSLPVRANRSSRAAVLPVRVPASAEERIFTWRACCRAISCSLTRKRISGLRPIVPVPVQGRRTGSVILGLQIRSVTSRTSNLMRSPDSASVRRIASSLRLLTSHAVIVSFRISLRQNRGLPARSRAGVQNSVSPLLRPVRPRVAILRPECGYGPRRNALLRTISPAVTRRATVRNSPGSRSMPSSIRSRSTAGSSSRIQTAAGS